MADGLICINYKTGLNFHKVNKQKISKIYTGIQEIPLGVLIKT